MNNTNKEVMDTYTDERIDPYKVTWTSISHDSTWELFFIRVTKGSDLYPMKMLD